MTKDVKEKVIEIIAEQALLDPTDIGDTSTLEDLGIDSLTLVETVFAIEETFNISIPFNANVQINSKFDISSIGSIVKAVEMLVNET